MEFYCGIVGVCVCVYAEECAKALNPVCVKPFAKHFRRCRSH